MKQVKQAVAVIGVALDVRGVAGLLRTAIASLGWATFMTSLYNWLGSFLETIPTLSVWLFGLSAFALGMLLIPRTGRGIQALASRLVSKRQKRAPDGSVPVSNPRTYATISPESLVDLCRSHTEYQAMYVVQPHIGTWLSVHDVVVEVNRSSEVCKVYVDSLEIQYMEFSQQHWHERLLILRSGDGIDAVGRIVTVSGDGIILGDCEFG